MKNITKTTQTILFASLIAAMILPFSAMEFAEAKIDNKIGKNIVKDKVSYSEMPTVDDVIENLKKQGHSKQQIDKMDVKQKHYDKHQEWLAEHRDVAIEQIVREKQILLTETLDENAQEKNPKDFDLPWTSIGYDYESNSLEVTVLPEEFTEKNIKKYLKTIRNIVGNKVDVTISPLENQVEPVSCISRTFCGDLKAGVQIGMNGKTFPCTLGFAANYNNNDGYVTAGHCFDGLSVGTDSYHPQSGTHIGDLEKELATTSSNGVRCDCAFVNSKSGYDVSDLTYGLAEATSTGSSTVDKNIKASLGTTNAVRSGVILDASRSYNDGETPSVTIGGYYYKYVVLTDINVGYGDSGSPVFSSDGSELLGFMVAAIGGDSIYVKENKYRIYFSGLTWSF